MSVINICPYKTVHKDNLSCHTNKHEIKHNILSPGGGGEPAAVCGGAPARVGQQRPHPADGGRARGRDDGRGEHRRDGQCSDKMIR